jgi:hypothetical protein
VLRPKGAPSFDISRLCNADCKPFEGKLQGKCQAGRGRSYCQMRPNAAKNATARFARGGPLYLPRSLDEDEMNLC